METILLNIILLSVTEFGLIVGFLVWLIPTSGKGKKRGDKGEE